MKVTFLALVCLCLHLPPHTLFASAEGKLAPSSDSFESASNKVSLNSSIASKTTRNHFEPDKFIRSLGEADAADAFMLGRPGTSYILGIVNEDCDSSELSMVPLDTSSSFQMWKYDSTSIQSIACPNKVITILGPSCESVGISEMGSVRNEVTFKFHDVGDLNDDETSRVTITNESVCGGKVLSDGSINDIIGSAITMRGKILFAYTCIFYDEMIFYFSTPKNIQVNNG